MNGADLQIYNTHGERAREAAARYQKDSCVEYLDRAGIYCCQVVCLGFFLAFEN